MTVTAHPAASTWSMGDARRVYAELAVPNLAELAGHWDGRFVGRPGLRRLTAAIAAVTPLRGWQGKEILASGEVVNLVARRDATHESIRAVAKVGMSVIDGRPTLVVDYSTAPRPVRWVRGELRWLTERREILGLLVFPIGSRVFGPFPFVMTPADTDPTPGATPGRGGQGR